MGLKRWLNQLITDAKAVWGAPGANRPLTRRWLIDKELSNRKKQMMKQDNDLKHNDHTKVKKNPDSVDS